MCTLSLRLSPTCNPNIQGRRPPTYRVRVCLLWGFYLLKGSLLMGEDWECLTNTHTHTHGGMYGLIYTNVHSGTANTQTDVYTLSLTHTLTATTHPPSLDNRVPSIRTNSQRLTRQALSLWKPSFYSKPVLLCLVRRFSHVMTANKD